MGDSNVVDASSDDGGTEADTTVEASSCTSSLGTLVGAETDFPIGTWKLVHPSFSDIFIVAQDADGFFAYSAICTHQGCIVGAPSNNGATFCPCHGSQFDGNGRVTAGPAFSPLQHYAVTICDGNVYVDGSIPVSSSTRTPPQ